ncbi:hypothetical protein NBT05_02715 [Aquimarina sp. ERC-38]|uniref:hypothetical protein n=1 Tax=Aquimarina sp. ERC-38 TaxID=2949996 RepID=UPI0022476F9B|nr:hypothetical protein [Aquimarina sp. ERC-38]UZO81393.1 hypothetical protein NBT05_02715 [Aquimarina sp. ERC-38]
MKLILSLFLVIMSMLLNAQEDEKQNPDKSVLIVTRTKKNENEDSRKEENLETQSILRRIKEKKTSASKEIETTIITIDLGSPDYTSIIHSGRSKRLIVKNRNPLAVKLINGNPLRYKYILSYEKINLFGSDDFTLQYINQNKKENEIDDPREYNNYIALDKGESIEELITDVDFKLKQLEYKIAFNFDKISKLQSLEYEDLEYFENEAFTDFSNILSLIDKINLLNVDDDSSNNVKLNINNSINSYKERLDTLFEKIKISNNVESKTYLLPLDVFGDNIDYVIVKLEIYDGENSSPYVHKFKIWLRGGLKIDFSGGAFITSLFDQVYTTNNTSENKKTITRNDLGEYDFGFGAMVNISLRGGSWVRPTINFGTLLTSNQKFQIISGAGIILGKNERFVLSSGLTMGRINVLDNNFIPDGTTSYDLGSSGQIPTTEKFSFGHFFGITYNLNN